MNFRPALVFLLLAACSSPAPSDAEESRRFVCDVLKDLSSAGKPHYDGEVNHFDRMFYYRKTEENFYETGALSPGKTFHVKANEEFFSKAYLTAAREQGGFYREIFDIWRFYIKEKILVHSYLYYLDRRDYEKNFSGPDFAPFNLPLLFDLTSKSPPDDYVKIGWDKTKWRCYEISYVKYFYLGMKKGFWSILSGT